jgi:hypothetical protein
LRAGFIASPVLPANLSLRGAFTQAAIEGLFTLVTVDGAMRPMPVKK